jgi:hypothetical protein
MIFGFIIGIVIAYGLTFVHVDQAITSGIKNIVQFDVGATGYYLLMGIAGGISRVMIGGFISGVIVAFILTYVNLDHFIIVSMKEWFKHDVGIGAYYLLFGVAGAGLSFLKVVRILLSPLFFFAKSDKRKG